MFKEPVFTETRPAIPQATLKTSTNGAIIDSIGFGVVEYEITVGIAGETLSREKAIDFKLMESDDGVTFEWVPENVTGRPNIYPYEMSTIVVPFFQPHPAPSTHAFRYRGAKRYTQLVCTFVGTHATGTPIVATAKLGNQRTAAKPV